MPTVEANGLEFYYEHVDDDGSGAGDADHRPPVVFLHGMGLDHRYWPAFATPLTDDYEVIVLDMRLHGRSGGDPAADITIDTYADDLRAFIDALDLDRPAIVGHSMGGMVALRFVDRYPDTAGALVTLGSETPDTPTRRAWFYDTVVFPVHDWLDDRFGQSATDRFMFTLAWLTRDTIALSDLDAFERIITDHHADYPAPSEGESEAIVAALDGYGDLDIDYEAIPVPVLALYGELEPAITAHHAHHLAESVPDGRALEVPDAAHVMTVDNPGAVRDEIRDFLDEHLSREPVPEPT